MPARGAKKATERARRYEHVKHSQTGQGRSEDHAVEIAARIVNNERVRAGESWTSTRDISPERRVGLRSGTNRENGPTLDQLYAEAERLSAERL